MAYHDLLDNVHVARIRTQTTFVLVPRNLSDNPRGQDHESVVSEWADWTYYWVSAEAARFHWLISYLAFRYASSETLANRKAAVR